ncbi:hypothetical protein pb186bvf_003252 [Paramecium bursaria]
MVFDELQINENLQIKLFAHRVVSEVKLRQFEKFVYVYQDI